MTMRDELFAYAEEIGADTIGVCSAEEFEAQVPNRQKPSTTANNMKSMIIFARHMLGGALTHSSLPYQARNSHLVAFEIDEITDKISRWLEDRDAVAVPVPNEAVFTDIDEKPMGSLDFKWVAEAAGIGTVGLDLNLLTPDHGPRVYLGVIMTDAYMEPTEPLDRDLCPGMSCGRCAVICPTQAVPTEAPLGEGVRDYRDLKKKSCAFGATRIGARSLIMNLRAVSAATHDIDTDAAIDNLYLRDLWQSLNSKAGAFASCFECWYVCPIGKKDFKPMYGAPTRKNDLPKGSVVHTRENDVHRVTHRGPPEERQHEYERDSELASILDIDAVQRK